MDKSRKIRRHLWKELLKINKIAKFESDLLKTNEEIAPEIREKKINCQKFGWFNGAETNCGIARILGILLTNSWDT